MSKVMVAAGLVLAFGCDAKKPKASAAAAPPAQPEAAPAPVATPPTRAERQRLIDAMNQRVDLPFRVSFGASDTELSVEFTDKTACSDEVLKKLIDSALAPLQNQGFEVLSCKPPPIEVTAKQLFADYEENQVNADGKYRGRDLRVTGIIWKVSKDLDGKPYVQLAADQYGFKNAWAYYDDEGRLGALKKGEKLVSRCLGSGVTVMDTPILKNCAIEHVFRWEPAK